MSEQDLNPGHSSGTQERKDSCERPTLERPSCPPFCSAGLRPIAPPRSLLHLPSRRFEKPLEKGRSSSLTASHRASTNRGRAAPPRPFSPSASGFRRKHQAGTFRRETSPQAPARTFSAAILRPSPVPRRSLPRGPWRTAFVVREVAKMVVVVVVKVVVGLIQTNDRTEKRLSQRVAAQ